MDAIKPVLTAAAIEAWRTSTQRVEFDPTESGPTQWLVMGNAIADGVQMLQSALAEIDRLTKERDGAYRERNQLVCALSKLFPSWLDRHPDSDTSWDAEWRWIVFVRLPTGQASWHIHDSERGWFDHLVVGGDAWDGHSTDEKYRRLAAITQRTGSCASSLGVHVCTLPSGHAGMHKEDRTGVEWNLPQPDATWEGIVHAILHAEQRCAADRIAPFDEAAIDYLIALRDAVFALRGKGVHDVNLAIAKDRERYAGGPKVLRC